MRWRLLAVAACLPQVAVGCTLGGSSGSSLPPPPASMDVKMVEYRFEHPPQAVRGRMVFRVHNAGSIAHEAILVALPEGIPPIAEQLRSDSRQAVNTIITLNNRAPGSSTTFATELTPGRYAFICFRRDPDGMQHFQKGMSSEFRVG